MGAPISQLWAGRTARALCRNTAPATTQHQRRASQPSPSRNRDQVRGPYDGQLAFGTCRRRAAKVFCRRLYRDEDLAFDPFAQRTDGTLLCAEDLKVALEPFRKIRQAVGERMEIMAEFHSLWDLEQAKRIARALEEYRPFWSEDPIKMCDVATLKEYARSTRIPVCASETLGGTAPFRDILQAQAADIVMLDVGWCGGLTEARKIAALAEAYQRPVAPHDCNGPVVWVASIHLMLHIPNALVMEAVRAYYSVKKISTETRKSSRVHLWAFRSGAGHASTA